ncbi:Alpha/beta hydrolase family protein [Planctomycetes bacterium CA13]|uniref:Alpha/beta hydrolase family protein n=1 Tax=Novipirellula herctigrandis TaxID=2527986 RepID=A0A5C5YNR5_9BACT|nr:Alpha/beta hydrolase family protein [Planctomycetes bacterium CA13]
MARLQSERFDQSPIARCSENSYVPRILFAILLATLSSCSQSTQSITEPNSKFDIDSVKTPSLPESLSFRDYNSVQIAEVDLGIPAGSPGEDDKIWVMRPKSTDRHHDPQKRYPCVFVAAAGATVLNGVGMSTAEMGLYSALTRQGFIVVGYGTDGDISETASTAEFVRAHQRFRASMSGLVNSRNAISLALATVPAIDPNRLYAVGHSSAAKHALLLATHEPRIRGCVSLAGFADILRTAGDQEEANYDSVFSDWRDFAVKASPATHAADLKCPVYLYHSDIDQVVSARNSTSFAAQRAEANLPTKLVISNTGDHYSAVDHINIAAYWLADLDECIRTGKTLLNGRIIDSTSFGEAAIAVSLVDGKTTFRRLRFPAATRHADLSDIGTLAITHDQFGFLQYPIGQWKSSLEPTWIFPAEGTPQSMCFATNQSSAPSRTSERLLACVSTDSDSVVFWDYQKAGLVDSVPVPTDAPTHSRRIIATHPAIKNGTVFLAAGEPSVVANWVCQISPNQDPPSSMQSLAKPSDDKNPSDKSVFPFEIPMTEFVRRNPKMRQAHTATTEAMASRLCAQPLPRVLERDGLVYEIEAERITITPLFAETAAETFPLQPDERQSVLDADANDEDRPTCLGWLMNSRYCIAVFPESAVVIDVNSLGVPQPVRSSFDSSVTLYSGRQVTQRLSVDRNQRPVRLSFQGKSLPYQWNASESEITFDVPLNAAGLSTFVIGIDAERDYTWILEGEVFDAPLFTPFPFTKILPTTDPNIILGLHDPDFKREYPTRFTQLAIFDVNAGELIATLQPTEKIIDAAGDTNQLFVLLDCGNEACELRRYAVEAAGKLEQISSETYGESGVGIHWNEALTVSVVTTRDSFSTADREPMRCFVSRNYRIKPNDSTRLQLIGMPMASRRQAFGAIAGGRVRDGVLYDAENQPVLLWDLPVPVASEAMRVFSFVEASPVEPTRFHFSLPYRRSPNARNYELLTTIEGDRFLYQIGQQQKICGLTITPWTPRGKPVATGKTIVGPGRASPGPPTVIGSTIWFSLSNSLGRFAIDPDDEPELESTNAIFSCRPILTPMLLDAAGTSQLDYECPTATEYRLQIRCPVAKSNLKTLSSASGKFTIDTPEFIDKVAQSCLRAASDYERSFDSPSTNPKREVEPLVALKRYASMMRQAYKRVTGETATGIPHVVNVNCMASGADRARSTVAHQVFVDLPRTAFGSELD